MFETFDAYWVHYPLINQANRFLQTLKVKYEASRRLLQKINEFLEEVDIVNNVQKQQKNVLLQFRSSLNPESFRAPRLGRKLRFHYECKAIDKILMTIKEHLRAYAELRDRAKQLSIEMYSWSRPYKTITAKPSSSSQWSLSCFFRYLLSPASLG